MAYGWRIYKADGSVLTDYSRFNCFFLDTWQSNPGNSQGNYDQYSKTFYGYEYSEIRVIAGAGPLVTAGGNVSGASDINVTISYNSSGVPTVTIRETRGNTTGSGSTFWITVSRLDPRSSILGSHGINLYDADGGMAFSPNVKPYVFAGKALRPSGGEPANTSYSYEEGYLAFETWSADPPLCFWRTTDGSYIPDRGAVRRSDNPPSSKNYRWALGVSTSVYGQLPESNSGMEAYCFEADPNFGGASHGIALFGGGNTLNLTNENILTIIKQAKEQSHFALSGEDLRIYTGSSTKNAMVPLYRFANFNNGIYDLNLVRWRTPLTTYVFGDHYRLQSGSYGNAGYNADWYRDHIVADDMATFIINCSDYD